MNLSIRSRVETPNSQFLVSQSQLSSENALGVTAGSHFSRWPQWLFYWGHICFKMDSLFFLFLAVNAWIVCLVWPVVLADVDFFAVVMGIITLYLLFGAYAGFLSHVITFVYPALGRLVKLNEWIYLIFMYVFSMMQPSCTRNSKARWRHQMAYLLGGLWILGTVWTFYWSLIVGTTLLLRAQGMLLPHLHPRVCTEFHLQPQLLTKQH